MTNKVIGYVRDPADGSGVSGATVAIKLHNGGSTVLSDGTDVNGQYALGNDALGAPGPVYEEVTVGATTKIRSGYVWGQLGGLIWAADVPDVFSALGIGAVGGVSDEFEVSANSSGMEVHVAAGIFIHKDGIPFVKEALTNLAVTAADVTHPRIDRVILRLTREGQTDQGKLVLVMLNGTAAASPVAPTLTQTSATWEVSLATVQVDANASTISAGKVTDERTFALSDDRMSTFEAALALKQTIDATITALAAYNTAGLLTQTAPDTFTGRTITGTANEITVSNGNGVSGNPTLSLASEIDATKIGSGIVSSTEYDRLDGLTGNIQTQLNDLTTSVATRLADTGDTITGDLIFTGNHGIRSEGTTPSTAYGAGAGSGGSINRGIEGTDRVGKVFVVTGNTSVAAGILLRITFDNPLADADYAVILTPADGDAANIGGFVDFGQLTATYWEISVATTPGNNTSFQWFYYIIPYLA